MVPTPTVPGLTSEQPNRRATQRFALDIRVVLMVGDGSTVRGAIGRSSDISEGGIGAFLPTALKIGQSCTLQFVLPGGEDMRVSGIVRTRSSFRYGIEFGGLSSRQREHIARACKLLAAL